MDATGHSLDVLMRRVARRRSPLSSAAVSPPPGPVLQVAQPEDGGVAEHVLRLSLGLNERGWPVEVATPPTSAIRTPLKDAGIRVHDVPMARSPGPHDA